MSTLADSDINKKTKFLKADKLILEELFDKEISKDPKWFLRKSKWEPVNGVLKGTPLDEGNGAFLRLKGKGQGGFLPENYIMNFKFKIGDKEDGAASIGHRISLGHYNYKVNWKGDEGIYLNILHGKTFAHKEFKVMKGKWYEVTIESKDDEILFSFKDGPSYFMQHEILKSKPAGWEYFINKKEFGYLDDFRVWSISSEVKPEWSETKKNIHAKGHSFLQSENPDFKTSKPPKAPKNKKKK